MMHLWLPGCPPQDAFLERHGVKLGFMSAFVKAAGAALQYVPAVNGVIDGNDIIYRCGGEVGSKGEGWDGDGAPAAGVSFGLRGCVWRGGLFGRPTRWPQGKDGCFRAASA